MDANRIQVIGEMAALSGNGIGEKWASDLAKAYKAPATAIVASADKMPPANYALYGGTGLAVVAMIVTAITTF
ncbi:MAG: hypothetical protein VR70_10835 [Rhodospirillaceae bacterium BRH_c57]|nr:MAG: hypothetical protein VR70_10835 [Rhodospirillaceae bacterium BRH_c57]